MKLNQAAAAVTSEDATPPTELSVRQEAVQLLKELTELRKLGTITDDEFATKKATLLDQI
jgi:hypothetical protein